MANSYYQTPTTPRLYVSYPLWQYANGGLYVDGDNIDMRTKLINLNPSNPTTIPIPTEESTSVHFGYNVVNRPVYDIDGNETGPLPKNLWNFNYCMLLNHNFHTLNAKVSFAQVVGSSSDEEFSEFQTVLNNESIVNWTNESACEYDGFSIFSLNGMGSVDQLGAGIIIESAEDTPLQTYDKDIQLGCVAFGRYFDFPQNCDLNTSLSYNYGTSSVKTFAGKSINTTKWTKADSWYNASTGGTEPFGLRVSHANETGDDDAYSFRKKSGLRVWNISFDSLAPKYLMNQNPMMNNYGWNSQSFENYSTDVDGESSYDIDNAVDFYTNCVHRTNGGSLPMVMQINKDDNSPHNFVIVKMSSYKITQKLPNLYNISLTLEEQV